MQAFLDLLQGSAKSKAAVQMGDATGIPGLGSRWDIRRERVASGRHNAKRLMLMPFEYYGCGHI